MEKGIFPSVKRRFLQVDKWCIWRDMGSLRCFGRSPKTGMWDTGRPMTFIWTELLRENWRARGGDRSISPGDQAVLRDWAGASTEGCGAEESFSLCPAGWSNVWRCTSCEQELVGMGQKCPLSGKQYALTDSSYLQSYPNCVSPIYIINLLHNKLFISVLA